MRSIPFFILASLAVPAFADDAPRQAITLEPDGPWLLDYSEERCRAARKFQPSDGSGPTLFFLEQYEPSANFGWLVAGGAVPKQQSWEVRFGPRHEAFSVEDLGTTFGDFGRAIKGTGTSGTAQGKDAAEGSSEPSSARESAWQLSSKDASAIKWFEIAPSSSRTVRLPLEDLAPLYSAMNECMSDLIETWGIDAEAQARNATGPKLQNITELVEQVIAYYPAKALDKRKSAFFTARIMVEADGAVSKCALVAQTIADDFDGYACKKIVEVARFEPALDTEGKPMRWFYFQNISYRMK